MPGIAREESEARTRRERVDPKLTEQGWTVVPFDPRCPPELLHSPRRRRVPDDQRPGNVITGRRRHARAKERPVRVRPASTPECLLSSAVPAGCLIDSTARQVLRGGNVPPHFRQVANRQRKSLPHRPQEKSH
jgi:hypothetical protein